MKSASGPCRQLLKTRGTCNDGKFDLHCRCLATTLEGSHLLAVIPAVAIAVAASSAFSSSGVTNPTMVVRTDKLSVDYRNKAVLWSGHVQLTLMNYAHYPFTIKERCATR